MKRAEFVGYLQGWVALDRTWAAPITHAGLGAEFTLAAKINSGKLKLLNHMPSGSGSIYYTFQKGDDVVAICSSKDLHDFDHTYDSKDKKALEAGVSEARVRAEKIFEQTKRKITNVVN